MIFFKAKGNIYKLSKDNNTMVLRVYKEDFEKLNTLANTTNLHFLKIKIKNMKIKDEKLLSYITNIKELEGKDVICSGFVKKYKFTKPNEDTVVEGVQFIANKLLR